MWVVRCVPALLVALLTGVGTWHVLAPFVGAAAAIALSIASALAVVATKGRARAAARVLAAERACHERTHEIGEEWTKAVLRSATDAIITIDESERITLFNAGAEQIFRCAASEALGQPIERFIPARFRGGHHAQIRAFGETGVSTRHLGRDIVLGALRADGEEFPMEARISQSAVGGEKLYTVILRDVTERLRVERDRATLLEDAQRTAAEAARANRAKDEFLAMISHELRTPLTPLLAWATLLRTRSFDAATTSRALECIERSARAQARLVEDLLDMSRIVAGKIRLDARHMELAPAVAAATDSLRPAAETKGLLLETDLRAGDAVVSGDRDRLQQVVWNLVANALKFTPRGGRVDVVLRRVGPQLELAVRDTGIGIERSFLPHVFERFRQHEASTTRSRGGLGLGLAIVRHIVELHGGTVACESAGPGQGTTVTVRLSVASRPPASPRAAEPRQDHVPAPAISPAKSDVPLANLRVLVVDDDPDTLDILVAILATEGMTVRTSQRAEDALAVVKAWRPDVLISDIAMPDEDGYALIRKIRALPPHEGGAVPALALTAYARFEDRRSVLSAGFQTHAAKPVVPADLLALVAQTAALAPQSRR